MKQCCLPCLDNVACEEVSQSNNENEAENEADVSIGTEIPDLDIADEMQLQDSVHSYEDSSTSYADVCVENDHGDLEILASKVYSLVNWISSLNVAI